MLIRSIAFVILIFLSVIPLADAHEGLPSCAIGPFPAECLRPNQPSSNCRVEALATIDAQCPLGLLFTVTGAAKAIDYTYPTYTEYLQADDRAFQVLAENSSPRLSKQLESSLENLLFPRRFGNANQNEWTPISQLYTRYVEVKGDALCLSLVAVFPFTGSLKKCTDGTTRITIRTADGLPTWAEAKATAEKLLLTEFQLDISNAEHFEVREPQLDAKLIRGGWHFVLRYEGRRRQKPYWNYVVTIPLFGKMDATISRQPWM